MYAQIITKVEWSRSGGMVADMEWSPAGAMHFMGAANCGCHENTANFLNSHLCKLLIKSLVRVSHLLLMSKNGM